MPRRACHILPTRPLAPRANLDSRPSALGAAPPPEPLYLFCSTWELPDTHRDQVVASLELQAGPADSAPLVFAITLE